MQHIIAYRTERHTLSVHIIGEHNLIVLLPNLMKLNKLMCATSKSQTRISLVIHIVTLLCTAKKT